MTVGCLGGSELGPAPDLASVPISAMILGTVLATVPASMWMARAGRRVGFFTGTLLGAVGGLVAASGIVVRSFFVLLAGLFLIGTYQAFTLFYRFAASEVSDDAFRPRAISLVLTGGVAAALLGPALASLGATGWTTVALSPAGEVDIDDLAQHPPERIALLLGAEGAGLREATLAAADHRVRIPLAPGVDSLNVATAAAVALHALRDRGQAVDDATMTGMS